MDKKRDERVVPCSKNKCIKAYKESIKGFSSNINSKNKYIEISKVPIEPFKGFNNNLDSKNKCIKKYKKPIKGFNNNLGKGLAKNISSNLSFTNYLDLQESINTNLYSIVKSMEKLNNNLSGLNFSNYLDLQKSINTNLYSIRKSMEKLNNSRDTLPKVSALHINRLSEFSKNFDKLSKEIIRRFKNDISVKDLVDDEYLALLLEVFSKDDEVKSYVYMKEDEVMTSMSVRFGGKVHFVNFTDNPLDCAFGRNESPVGLGVFLDFLEERCIPKHRFNIDEVLEGLGLSEYNEVDIVEKTYGVLIDDSFWVKYSNDLITYEEALEKVGLGGLKKLGGTLDG